MPLDRAQERQAKAGPAALRKSFDPEKDRSCFGHLSFSLVSPVREVNHIRCGIRETG